MKICRGPLHREGKPLPLDNFLKQPDGRPRSYCRACDSARKGAEQQVKFSAHYHAWLELIVNRLGPAEASRRLPLTYTQLWALRNRPPEMIRRRTARKIVTLLNELNCTEEVRHRLSIRHGASARGRPERSIELWVDYYRPHGDEQTMRKRRDRRG